MARAPLGSRWAEAVAAGDAVAGAVLLIAGAYLIEPGIIDLGLYLEAERYLLAGLVLAYAGLVLTYAGLLGLAPPAQGFVPQLAAALFGTAARLCVAALTLTFAVRAGLAGLPSLWVVLPAGAGLLALLSVPFASIARARVARTAASRTITADTGKTNPFIAATYVRFALTFVITVCISIFIFGFAFVAYILLDRAFIEGRPIDLSVAVVVVRGSLVPIVVVVAQLCVALAIVGGVANWFIERQRRRGTDGRERDLSAEEISFASQCVAQVRDTYAARGPAGRAMTGPVWFMVAFVAVLVLAFLDSDHLIAQIYAPPTEAWQFYLVDGPGAKIAGLVLLISLAFVPSAVLKLVSPRAAEASGARMLKVDRAAGELEAEIVKRVRDRSLRPGMPFDAGELMRTWGVTTGVIALVWNLLLVGGVALWWPHDRARDTLFTEDGIETGDFWTMERTVYRYDAVEAVYVMCDGNDDVGYQILLPGEVRREVLSEIALSNRLDDLAKVDGKLRQAGAAFVFALPQEALALEAPVVDRMCVLGLTEGVDEARRAKIEQVLHLDEWYERRWRLRTGERPRVSTR